MPDWTELADQRPYLVRRRREIDAFGDGLQLRVRRGEIREHLGAGLGRTGRSALQEFAILVDEPRQQDVDRVGIERATTTGLVGTSIDSALLDLQMACIGDRLGDVEE